MNNEVIKDYLKEHLKIRIFVDDDNRHKMLCVSALLDNDQIDYDYIIEDDFRDFIN